MWRKKDRVAGKRVVASLRLPDVTPEIRLAMSWTPPGGHEVISKPKAKPKVKAKAPGSSNKKKVAHSRSAKTKAKNKRTRTSVAA